MAKKIIPHRGKVLAKPVFEMILSLKGNLPAKQIGSTLDYSVATVRKVWKLGSWDSYIQYKKELVEYQKTKNHNHKDMKPVQASMFQWPNVQTDVDRLNEKVAELDENIVKLCGILGDLTKEMVRILEIAQRSSGNYTITMPDNKIDNSGSPSVTNFGKEDLPF